MAWGQVPEYGGTGGTGGLRAGGRLAGPAQGEAGGVTLEMTKLTKPVSWGQHTHCTDGETESQNSKGFAQVHTARGEPCPSWYTHTQPLTDSGSPSALGSSATSPVPVHSRSSRLLPSHPPGCLGTDSQAPAPLPGLTCSTLTGPDPSMWPPDGSPGLPHQAPQPALPRRRQERGFRGSRCWLDTNNVPDTFAHTRAQLQAAPSPAHTGLLAP